MPINILTLELIAIAALQDRDVTSGARIETCIAHLGGERRDAVVDNDDPSSVITRCVGYVSKLRQNLGQLCPDGIDQLNASAIDALMRCKAHLNADHVDLHGPHRSLHGDHSVT